MSWINNIGTAIKAAFNGVREPVIPIPPVLLLCEIMNRPGLSAIALAASIIARLSAEGFPTGVNEDGSENMNNKFILIMCEELVNEIQTNGVVQSSVAPGSISITGIGANAGGPISIQGFNDKVAEIKGIIR